jgi:hypothetical protein
MFKAYLEDEPPEYRRVFFTIYQMAQIMQPTQPDRPAWIPIVGYVSGTITLLYLMGLATYFALLHPEATLSPSAGYLLSAILALGVALAFSFIGGDAAAKGRLSIPQLDQHPVEFAVVGGIGVFVLVFFLAEYLFPH